MPPLLPPPTSPTSAPFKTSKKRKQKRKTHQGFVFFRFWFPFTKFRIACCRSHSKDFFFIFFFLIFVRLGIHASISPTPQTRPPIRPSLVWWGLVRGLSSYYKVLYSLIFTCRRTKSARSPKKKKKLIIIVV